MNINAEVLQAVGFLEGEGCILLNPKGYASIEAEQVDPAPLFQLQKALGGIVTRRKTRDVWRWRLSKKPLVKEFLEALSSRGWGNKKDQAQTLLLYLNEEIRLDTARSVISALKHNRPHSGQVPQKGSENGTIT